MPTHKKQMAEVSLNQLTELTGKAFRTLKRRLERIEPVRRDGKTIFYSAPEALAAIYGGAEAETGEGDDKLNLTLERAKLARRQTEKLELEIEVTRGNLLPSEIVERFVGDMVSAYRARSLVIASRAAPLTAVSADIVENETIIRELVYEALAELRDYRPEHYQPPSKKLSTESDEVEQ